MKWIMVKMICILLLCNYAVGGRLDQVVAPSDRTSTNGPDDENNCKCEKNHSPQRILETIENVFKETRVKLCSAGMQDFRIADNQISSSDYWHSETNAGHSHIYGRLYNTNAGAQAYCGLIGGEDKWVQVDFQRDVKITGVVMQGRPNADQWVTLFNVQYKSTVAEEFMYAQNDNSQNLFAGNVDRNTLSITSFSTPIVARFFRINILDWKGHTCMRFDFMTC